MINNTANNCKAYVLTAAHCGAGASTAYGFQLPALRLRLRGSPVPNTQMVSGGTVRGNFASSDFTLVEMSALPPQSFNFYLNGWSRDPNPSTSSWVIHHPSGDFKKISLDSDPADRRQQLGAEPLADRRQLGRSRPSRVRAGDDRARLLGLPSLDQDHRITGQLHGGTASCSLDTWDEYGKVAASWTGGGAPASRLSDWLDP